MVETSKIREEIKTRVDKIPADRLSDILEFVKKFESEQEDDSGILSYFGIWADLDKDLLEDLTVNLHKNRMEPVKEY